MALGDLAIRGYVRAQVMHCQRAPLSWRLRNMLRWNFVVGWLQFWLAYLVAAVFRVPTLRSSLSIRLRRADGRWIDYGVVGFRKVTKAGVTYLANDWAGGASDMNAMKYHGCGTGAGAEANTQTALVTECTTALNPDSTRATGTQTVVGADNNILHSEGTLTFDDAAAVIEHGLLSQEATGGGTLWDRTLFSAINVASGDSILFKYECTVAYEA